MPVILATCEEEITVLRATRGKKTCETPCQPMDVHSGVCLSSQLHREAQIGGWLQHEAKIFLFLKNNQ
jgi:hypothetical protein